MPKLNININIKGLCWSLIMLMTSLAEAKTDNSARRNTGISYREIFKLTASQWSGDIFLLPKRGNYMLDSDQFDPKNWSSSSVAGKQIPKHPITMHGVAWDYDLRIPMVFYDPSQKWFRSGKYQKLAVQQDIVPTLSDILDIPVGAKNTGRVLNEARQTRDSKTKPKVMIILVQDQVGKQYYTAHPGKAKFLESLLAKGASFENGMVAHVDVETSVGHAAIGSGAWPAEHGVAGNNFFHNGINRLVAALGIQTGPDRSTRTPHPLMYFTPTLSDVWSLSQNKKPVILAVASVPRAAIAMGGHGALFDGGGKSYVTWMDDDRDGGFWTTESQNYQMPESFKEKSLESWIKQIVDADGRWFGHKLVRGSGKLNVKLAMATPALARQQTDMTMRAIEELRIGEDEVTDLVWINMKSTDYCGHAFGFESDECGEVLADTDDAARRVVEMIDSKTKGDFILVLTADHGAAPLPELSGSYRLDREKLRDDMNHAFDKNDNKIDVVQVITSSQIYVNQSDLKANGFKMRDLVRYLKAYKAEMREPYNVLAEEWIKRGKPKESLFFEDVILKSDLVK